MRLAWIMLLVAACSDTRHGITDSGSPLDFTAVFPLSDAGSSDLPALVYAHSDTTLYTIDADTLVLTKVAPFGWPNGADAMTDIAIDKNGNMVGISSTDVYSVNPTTAKCTHLSVFNGSGFNGLSFIASSSTEVLVGASSDGTVYRIDPSTGAQTQIGDYGSGWGSSGDLVSVQGATYATVDGSFESSDVLVKVDPATGHATQIGVTGVSNIWGLGYWKQKLFGFTQSDGIVTIDIHTGTATAVPSSQQVSWYGAGVTTAAPTTIQ